MRFGPEEKGAFRPVHVFWMVALFALTIRLVHLLAISRTPFSSLYMGDGTSYALWAMDLAGGDWIGDRAFYQAPLYPYLLGVIYTLVGNHPMVVRVAQVVMGSFACGFIALAAHRLFGDRAGWTSGLVLAVYAPAIFYDGVVQKTSLAFFLTSLLIWLLARLSVPTTEASGEAGSGTRRGAPRSVRQPVTLKSGHLWLLLGAVLGLLVLTRENALVLLPVLVAWVWFDARWSRQARLVATALILLGTLIALGPVAIRNWAVSGESHLTTSQFGPNFYMGNNPTATGLPQPLRIGRDNPRFERRDAVLLAERAMGRELSPGEVSAYWTDQATSYIRAEPLDWLGLMGRKLFLFWNDVEIGDTEDLYTYADESPLLGVLRHIFRFGTLALIGLLGLWVTRGDHRLWPYRVLPLFYMASVLIFFIFSRYRHPVAPFLALFAGAAATRAPDFLRRASRKERIIGSGALLTAAVVLFWPTIPLDEMRANTWASVGAALEPSAGPVGAIPYYRRALELDPRSPTSHYYLASALQREGRLDEALSSYRDALRLQPARPEIHNNYGIALLASGRRELASNHFRQAVELDPAYPDALINLGTLALAEGDLDTAGRHYRSAVTADPRSIPARTRLGHALLAGGEVDAAFEHYRIAAREGARGEVLRRVAPVAWRMATHPDRSIRRTDQAVAVAENLVELVGRPGPILLRILAAAQAGTGRYDEAATTASRALEELGSGPEARTEEEGIRSRIQGDIGGVEDGVRPLSADRAAIQAELAHYRRRELPPAWGWEDR